MDSPVKNTRLSCHSLLQGIYPTEGLNPSPESPILADGFLCHYATYINSKTSSEKDLVAQSTKGNAGWWEELYRTLVSRLEVC